MYDPSVVTFYKMVDFLEHGSDHSPIYVRLKVYTSYSKSFTPPKRRILRYSGIESQGKQLSFDSSTKQKSILKIGGTCTHLDLSKAATI